MTGSNRIAVLAVAVVVAVVGFFVARDAADDDESSTTATVTVTQTATAPSEAEAEVEPESEAPAPEPERPAEPRPPLIVVRDGEPDGGVRELSFEKGGEVDFRVRSDAADEVHVHGYDETAALPAGKTVRIRFPASIDGRFEVELHGAHTQIARLEVTP